MSANVDWDFARSVAERVAGQDSFGESYHMATLEADLLELTTQAEALVEAETGLISTAGPARARVADRMGWVDANLASFERLMKPLLSKLADASEESDDEADVAAEPKNPAFEVVGELLAPVGKAFGAVGDAVGPKVAGLQLGLLLGWMSARVLGQYDLLIAEDDNPDEQDWVYYVGPNVLALERRYGFPPQEFRLWIAVHECTHRAQFTGVPWLRDYFLSLVNELLDDVDPDPGRLFDVISEHIKELRDGNRPDLKDGGLSVLLASPEQKATMAKVAGLMSLLEGHGDIIMDRATKDLVPSQARFSRVMSQRRKNAGGLTKLVQRLTGMEAKLAQYEEGEEFVRAVEAAGGKALFDKVWTSPETLPTIDEIREPQLWIDRMAD
ncbi:MAG: zinc-dependent metalloprotease [Actinomycetota bacterium]